LGVVLSLVALFFALFNVRLFSSASGGVQLRSAGDHLRSRISRPSAAPRGAAFAKYPVRSLLDTYFDANRDEEGNFFEDPEALAISNSGTAAAAAAAAPAFACFLKSSVGSAPNDSTPQSLDDNNSVAGSQSSSSVAHTNTSSSLDTANMAASGLASPVMRAADDDWAREVEANSVRLSVALETYLQTALAATHPNPDDADADAIAEAAAAAAAAAARDREQPVAGVEPGGESVVWLNLLIRRALQFAVGLGVEVEQSTHAAAAAAAAAAATTANTGAQSEALGSPVSSPLSSPLSKGKGGAGVSARPLATATGVASDEYNISSSGSDRAQKVDTVTTAAALSTSLSPRPQRTRAATAGAAASATASNNPNAASNAGSGSSTASASASRRPAPFDASSSVLVQLANAALARAPLPDLLGVTQIETLYPGVVAPLIHRVAVLSAEPGEPIVFEVEWTYTGDSVLEVSTSLKIDAFGIKGLASMPVQVRNRNC